MKNILKFLIICIIVSPLFNCNHVNAKLNENIEISNSSDSDFEFNITIFNRVSRDRFDPNMYMGEKLSQYGLGGDILKSGNHITGEFTWENPEYIIKSGTQTVKIIYKCEPDNLGLDNDEMVITADVTFTGIKEVKEHPDADGPSEPVRDVEAQAATTTDPSLTSATILMNKGNTYDINVNDKVAGTYTWTSSNPKVAKVNSKNGYVTAVANGNAKITCKITATDGQAYTLVSNVTVGLDDNFPVLTDNVLDLNPGNQYDLGVENQIAGSKYRYRSSNRSITMVNASNGIITAKGVGKANIYCTITTPDKQVIVLKCEVNVTK